MHTIGICNQNSLPLTRQGLHHNCRSRIICVACLIYFPFLLLFFFFPDGNLHSGFNVLARSLTSWIVSLFAPSVFIPVLESMEVAFTYAPMHSHVTFWRQVSLRIGLSLPSSSLVQQSAEVRLCTTKLHSEVDVQRKFVIALISFWCIPYCLIAVDGCPAAGFVHLPACAAARSAIDDRAGIHRGPFPSGGSQTTSSTNALLPVRSRTFPSMTVRARAQASIAKSSFPSLRIVAQESSSLALVEYSMGISIARTKAALRRTIGTMAQEILIVVCAADDNDVSDRGLRLL
jgi:hypothetical protein